MRADPPFPYLRWLGSQTVAAGRLWTGRPAVLRPAHAPTTAARTAARRLCGVVPSAPERPLQVLRQRRDDVDLRAGDRVREREPRGVQELALEAVGAGGPVLRIAAHRVPARRHV